MELKSTHPDFLVLGLGLAGASVALQLHRNGHSVCVVHDPKSDSASWKAGGLVNPVTGRRMARTWNFSEVFPMARSFYRSAFEWLRNGQPGSYLEERPILKAVHSVEEMNFISGKSANLGYRNLIDISTAIHPPWIFNGMKGWCTIYQGGRLDPANYLKDCTRFFRENGLLLELKFRKEDLIRESGRWKLGTVYPRTIISCLGNECPWIGPELWPVKGQLYELSGLPYWGNAILKTEKFLIPVENGRVLAGSTYEREFTHPEPDEEGLQEILNDLLPEVRSRIRIESAWAGFRPTTPDRRPIIRKIENQLFALNGLGAKGVSLSPWAAEQLIRLMQVEPAE